MSTAAPPLPRVAGKRELGRFRADALLRNDARGLELYVEEGITDYVLCLECGTRNTDIYSHLRHCGVAIRNGAAKTEPYRLKWPGAVMRSWNEHKKQKGRGRVWYASKSPAAKLAATEWSKNHPKERKVIEKRAQRKRIRTGKLKRYQQMAKYGTAEKVTPEEIERLLANPASMAPRCICLALNPEHIRKDSEQLRCGRILAAHIDKHLAAVHGEDWQAYSAAVPGALRVPTGHATIVRRPGDWEQKPQWHVLGNKLLSCDYISNPDLKAWTIASGHYTGLTFPSFKTVQRIRDWVGRPLGPRGQKASTDT